MRAKCWVFGARVASSVAVLLGAAVLQAQEPDADTSTEGVKDAFQELFFAALGQTAIEDYDRAIQLLGQIPNGSDVAVVQYELARNYRLSESPGEAISHARRAATLEPGNRWYWEEVIENGRSLGKASWDDLRNLGAQWDVSSLEAVSRAYIGKGMYSDASAAIREVSEDRIRRKLDDLLARRRDIGLAAEVKPFQPQNGRTEPASGASVSAEDYRKDIQGLIKSEDWNALEELAGRANREFPLQTDFSAYLGMALNRKGDYKSAKRILEEARSYLIDETDPEGKLLLGVLLETYRGLGDALAAARIEAILKKK